MRRLGAGELEAVRRTLAPFGDQLLDAWLAARDAELWTVSAAPRNVWLVPLRLGRALEGLRGGPSPVRLGLEVGRLVGAEFRLGLEGAHDVALRARRRRVFLTHEAGQRFLYGRLVAVDRGCRWDPDASDGGVVLVLGPDGASLGIGEWQRGVGGAPATLRPLRDRGWYLRSGG